MFLDVLEFGTNRPAVSPGVQHVFPSRIRRGRARPVHAVHGILHARRLRYGARRREMVRRAYPPSLVSNEFHSITTVFFPAYQ